MEEQSGEVFEKLLRTASTKGIDIKFTKLNSCYGIIANNCIGLHSGLTLDEINRTLAHELAHAYLHYDKGDIINNEGEYEEQAERAANLILAMASI